ncbi:hypothetical protein J6590_074476 [Homalodisca vitripennis]|nr:hypothetical protein J6590_074476 [Homalodisca vitripennis]
MRQERAWSLSYSREKIGANGRERSASSRRRAREINVQFAPSTHITDLCQLFFFVLCCVLTVCYKAFLALHGITNRRVQTLKKQLTAFGEPQTDGKADGNKSNYEKGVRAHQYPFLCFVRNKLVCVDCLPLS